MTWEQRGAIRVWVGMHVDDERHGTVAGHQEHRKWGETPCLSCLDAWNADQVRRRDRAAAPCECCGRPTSRTLCRSCATTVGNQARDYERREFCARGHRLTPENRTARGDACQTCHRDRARKYRGEQKQRRLELAIAAHWTERGAE